LNKPQRKRYIFLSILTLSLNFLLLPLSKPGLTQANAFEPYILLGETGKNFDGTREAIIQKFFMNDVEILGKYRPVDDSRRYMFIITTKHLKKAARNGGDYGLFLGALHLALDMKGDMVYLSVPNIDYWGNLYLRDDFEKVGKAVGEFKTDLPRLLPKLRGRFMRPFGAAEPLTSEKLKTYRHSRRYPTLDEMIELGQFEQHADAVKFVEEGLKGSEGLKKLYRFDVIRKDATLFGVQIPQESEIAEILDWEERKRTPFYPWQIAVVNGRVFAPAPLFRIPAGFPDLSRRQVSKLKKLAKRIENSVMELAG
jgi:hypothetical protein